MSRPRKLTKIDGRGARTPMNVWNVGSSLVPGDPAHKGDLSFTCPECGTVLLEQFNLEGLSSIEFVKCYVCGVYSTGKDAGASSGPAQSK